MGRYVHVMRIAAAAVLLLPAARAAAQQGEQEWLDECQQRSGREQRAVHCEVRRLSVPLGAGSLRIDAGPNGGVVVRSGAVQAAEVSARVQAYGRTQADAREAAAGIRIATGNGTIESAGPAAGGERNWSVTYHVTVPRNTSLDLSTVNGPISVAEVTGRIRTEALNGPVRLERLAGDVRARVRNGPLTVVLAGNGWSGEGLDAETVNGPARLIVPEDYSAVLEIGTVNGPANIGFAVPVTIRGRMPRHFTTTLGAGGSRVRVVTTNGPFSLQHP